MKMFRQIFFFSVGVALMIIGVVGLALPILPGWLFLFAGLSMVAPRLAARLRWKIFERRFKKDAVVFDEWLKLGVEAGFTTRHFPLRLTKSDDLLNEDNQKEFLKNFASCRPILKSPLQPLEKLVFLKQVHGDRIEVIEDADAFEKSGFYSKESADGAITKLPRLTLLVFSADCLTIFFAAGEWVGLAHAGWRGTKSNLAPKMLKLISEKSGIPCPQVRVIFGPRIGAGAYEVGPEFGDHFPKRSLKRVHGKLHFDLSHENKSQLLEAGVLPKNVIDHGVCTVAGNSDFYSFRKEGVKAGRMVSFITKL